MLRSLKMASVLGGRKGIPVFGDSEALGGLIDILLLTTSSVTVLAKSPSVKS